MTREALSALGPEDFETLANLLARFAANDLDQWEAWRLNVPGGPVDVRIAVADPADTGISVIWPRPQ